MIPTRQQVVGKNIISEWVLSAIDKTNVYINGKQVLETYDQAVKRLEGEES